MLQPKLFRREPTEITAIQFTGENVSAVADFVGFAPPNNVLSDSAGFIERHDPAMGKTEYLLWVQANESWLPIVVGEWVAHDEHGFYPIKDKDGKPSNYVEANRYSPGDQISYMNRGG